jgi:hypothetical protein
MTDRQSTHADDCWSWGPKHYECAVRELEERAQRHEALLRQALEALEEARNALYEALAKLEEK